MTRWKLTLTIPVLFLGLFISFFIFWQAAAQDPLDATFASSDESTVFRYPSSWVVEEESEGTIALANSQDALDAVDEDDFTSGQVAMLIFPSWYVQASLDIDMDADVLDALTTFVEVLRENNEDITYGDPVALTIADHAAARSNVKSGPAEGLIFLIDFGDSERMLVLGASFPGEFATFEPTVLAITETIRYVPPTTPRPTPTEFAFPTMVVIVTATPPPTVALSSADYEATISALRATIQYWESGGNSPATSTSTRTDGCEVYSIQPGDTLFSIAVQLNVDINSLLAVNNLDETVVLSVGQELLIPDDDCHPAAIATGTPLPLPSPLPQTSGPVQIVEVSDAGNLSTEGVQLTNVSSGVVDLTGWQLIDSQGNTFTFPTLRLFGNGVITVFTRSGSNTPIALFWGQDEAMWDINEIVTLVDANGQPQAIYVVQ